MLFANVENSEISTQFPNPLMQRGLYGHQVMLPIKFEPMEFCIVSEPPPKCTVVDSPPLQDTTDNACTN